MLRLIWAPLVMIVFDIGAIACLAELIDIVIGSFFFLVTGDFVSVIDHGILLGMSWVSLWDLRTGLVGFDFLLNAYLNLQFTSAGRWSLFGISVFVFIAVSAYHIRRDRDFSELIDTNTSTGSWVVYSAALPSLIVISPIWFTLFAGLMAKVFGIP